MHHRRLRSLGACALALVLSACGSSVGPATPDSSAASSPPVATVLPSLTAAMPSAEPASPAETPGPASPAPSQLPGKPNRYVLISQLNLWYHGPGCYGGFEAFDCSGKRTSPFEPALGHTYFSEDPDVVRQQIDWAAAYGVDAFSIEWTTPDEVQGSLEPIIDGVFLQAPNLNKIRWCIYDDFVLRLDQTKDLGVDISKGINLDDPKVHAAFVSDFGHFAQKYFGQAQYLKIDGRPVITLFADWNYQGNLALAIKDARAAAGAYGYDPYIVGEEMRGDQFDARRVALFDATTNFNFATPGVPDKANMGAEAASLNTFFASWKAKLKGLKVAGTATPVGFEPYFGPQEDNRLFAPKANHIYVPAQSKDQVAAMARVARDSAEPAGSQGQMLIWENTWNNWAEGTTIEPTSELGPKYPAGNYGFDFLEVMRDVFGPEIFPPN